MSRVLDLWAGMTGTVLDFAGSAAPTGWLLCYGQAVSRTTYAPLFAAIGTTFGAGDGSTTFNLPDCRGRVHAGKDNMGGSAAGRLTNSGTGNPGVDGSTLGAGGGVDRYTLTQAQLAAHTHDYTTTSGAVAVQSGSSATVVAGQVTAQTGNIGANAAHPIVQPTLVLNKIIKT